MSAATAGHLLAVLDRQNVYLLACKSPDQQHVQQDASCAAGSAAGLRLQLLSSCCVPVTSKLQLASVAWSDAGTVCVGDSEGGCQVLQVGLQLVCKLCVQGRARMQQASRCRDYAQHSAARMVLCILRVCLLTVLCNMTASKPSCLHNSI